MNTMIAFGIFVSFVMTIVNLIWVVRMKTEQKVENRSVPGAESAASDAALRESSRGLRDGFATVISPGSWRRISGGYSELKTYYALVDGKVRRLEIAAWQPGSIEEHVPNSRVADLTEFKEIMEARAMRKHDFDQRIPNIDFGFQSNAIH